tara:strand:+ start:2340 stop:2813 length:474 start_codon:yes stop_codon:yes gene_type:complete
VWIFGRIYFKTHRAGVSPISLLAYFFHSPPNGCKLYQSANAVDFPEFNSDGILVLVHCKITVCEHSHTTFAEDPIQNYVREKGIEVFVSFGNFAAFRSFFVMKELCHQIRFVARLSSHARNVEKRDEHDGGHHPTVHGHIYNNGYATEGKVSSWVVV